MTTGFQNVPDVGQQLTDNVLEGNLGGIFSTRPSAKYLSGARCILKINNRPVGFAFAVQWRIDTLYAEINAVDNPLPEELVPKAIKVSGSISALHIPGQGAGVQLWQPDVLSFLFHQYLTIEVRDRTTGSLLFLATKAVITSRQEDIRVDDLAQVSLNFQAIGYQDEKVPAVPEKSLTQSSATSLNNGDINTEPKEDINSASRLITGLLG
jgi:hypothetical protein